MKFATKMTVTTSFPQSPTPATTPRVLFGLALAVIVGPVGPMAAQAAHPVSATASGHVAVLLDRWFSRARRAVPGTWGIAVADASGTVLWQSNAEQLMVPASTVKLFTTGFARATLGGDARRATRVVGTGWLDPLTGEWIGDWALEFNGDPTLDRPGSGPNLADLARQLALQGVRRLSGPLQLQSHDGPADAVYPAAWSPRHRGRLFAPPIGALTLNENTVTVTIRPGPRPGTRAVLAGEMPKGVGQLVTIRATTTTGSRARLRLLETPEGRWLVTGTIGSRARPASLGAVAHHPRVVVTAAWEAALDQAGIVWTSTCCAPLMETAPIHGAVLAEVRSAPLDSLAEEINRRSLNVGAELLLRWAGGTDGAPSRLTEHVRQVSGRNGVYLVDGSGLSGDDRVSPLTFISYLANFPGLTAGRNFPLLLPANGTGTLAHLRGGLPEQGVVRAKTGTLRDVSTVVGYLGRPDGVLLVSLMYNGRNPTGARRQQWQLFRLLGADGVVVPAEGVAEPEQLGSDGPAS